jgi:hypothetical protein
MMEDKLKRYEKVEYLGEGQVTKNPYTFFLLRQYMPLNFEIHTIQYNTIQCFMKCTWYLDA